MSVYAKCMEYDFVGPSLQRALFLTFLFVVPRMCIPTFFPNPPTTYQKPHDKPDNRPPQENIPKVWGGMGHFLPLSYRLKAFVTRDNVKHVPNPYGVKEHGVFLEVMTSICSSPLSTFGSWFWLSAVTIDCFQCLLLVNYAEIPTAFLRRE